MTWVWAILLTASISSIWFGLLHAYWAYANETHHRHRRRHRHHRIVIVIIVTVIVIIIVMVITIITSLSMMIVWSMGNPADLCTAPSDAGDSEARTFRQTVEAVSMLKQVRAQFLELLHDCTMVWKMEFQWITIVSMYTYHGCSFSCQCSAFWMRCYMMLQWYTILGLAFWFCWGWCLENTSAELVCLKRVLLCLIFCPFKLHHLINGGRCCDSFTVSCRLLTLLVACASSSLDTLEGGVRYLIVSVVRISRETSVRFLFWLQHKMLEKHVSIFFN